jgi:RAT1-interacting protein
MYWGQSLEILLSGFNHLLLTQSGYKFEALALLPDTWDAVSRDFIESRDQHVVDNFQQYCSIVETGIGSNSLILGGEVDAGM